MSKDREWRPPHICFSKSPSLAWGMSALTSDIYGEWDLWLIWSIDVKYKTLNTIDGKRHNTEYRVLHRIPKSKVWYVGSRERKSRKSNVNKN